MDNSSASIQTVSKATLGMGCFWCTEAVFQRLKGVVKVVSGYEGGNVPNPSYEEVSTGLTNHAEVLEITFKPNEISFSELLEVFWKVHDPTTLNRQGGDVGTQYRSVIFYHNEQQKEIAQKQIDLLNKENVFGKKVVTTLEEKAIFYPAEDYHQNYFNRNQSAPYCQLVILPKIEKLEKLFREKLKQ
ncbi:MAG: peptide-methionine (S)-S-oxide reductase [Pedobacter sp.]|nr:MAG: peptide-methionine (S)-S-oxide reductase [Pedobacter sp.]